MAARLRDLADVLGRHGMPCKIEGDADRRVIGVATLEDAGPDEISFLANAKYERALQTTSAGAVIVSNAQPIAADRTALRVADPYAAVTAVIVELHGYRRHDRVGIDSRSVIAKSAKIGDGASIHHGVTVCENVAIGRNAVLYPGCYIAAGCVLGDDCVLFPNVVVYEGSRLGDRVTIHAGSVIGEDGLGYAPVDGTWRKIPQVGVVEIGDDVEIGANCTIDRATLGKTVIGAGTKFSNLIAIGHGSKIGPNCMFVAQVGVAGSVTVGKNVTLAGKVGIAGHLNIGDHAQLAAMSGVMNDVPANASYAGAPAIPIKDAMRSFSIIARLPELHKQIKRLEAEVESLKKALDERR